MQHLPHIPTVDILGVNVAAISLDDAVGFVEAAVTGNARSYVCVTGAHGIVECRRDAALRGIHRDAGMVTPDGMPVVWCLRALGAGAVTRVYGPDLMLAASERLLARGARHYYYGGGTGIADRLAAVLSTRFPGLAVAGTCCPPFREQTDDEIDETCAGINASGADIVWVGLGTPRQEYWMARARGRLEAPLLIGVGAAFDFHAGAKKQAPAWMRRNGLEWLFRAVSEPRRLGPRYLRVVPLFAILALRQIIAARLR
ncbi:MAG: WecB/TagA/CpsF family glycosyltransferase [Rhodospirillaceae bacterium]